MKSFIKTQCSKSSYDTVLRDLDEEEMRDFVAQSFGMASGDNIPLRAFTTEAGDTIFVAAPETCNRNLPVSYRFKGHDGKEYAFRGDIAVCGAKGEEPSDLPNMDELLTKYRVEPMYKDDAVCIPSLTEWEMLPERMRDHITPSFWIWTRTKADAGSSERRRVECVSARGCRNLAHSANDNSGGIAPFINLRQIDEATASKMREMMGRRTRVTLSAAGYEDVSMIKVSNDIYACSSDNWKILLSRTDLGAFDTNGQSEYKDSTLRAFLNGEYLDSLTSFIEKVQVVS